MLDGPSQQKAGRRGAVVLLWMIQGQRAALEGSQRFMV